jgi:molybdate transport system substrate-binding protein
MAILISCRNDHSVWKAPILTVATAVVLMFANTSVQAVQLKLLVGGAMSESFKAVGDDFSRKTGNTLDYRIDTTGALQKALRSGDKADVILVSAAGMDQLQKEHLISEGTRIELARALIGVSVRTGTAAPDISTVDAFKKSLLAARSIAYVDPKDGGTSGIYLDGLFKNMGIADEIKKKDVLRKHGSEVAAAVAKGDAELGLTFVSEMMPNKGVRIVGSLPLAIQGATNYAVAIPAASTNPIVAQDFVNALTSREGYAVIRSTGLQPIGPVH